MTKSRMKDDRRVMKAVQSWYTLKSSLQAA